RLAAIGQLASGVGHELRNPLAAIKNALYFIRSVLKKNPPPQQNDQVQQMLEIAENEIHSTVKISNDLLEFSRVLKISPAQVVLQTILDSALSVVNVPENVTVVKNLDPNLPPVTVDQERFRQVFINLLNNAVEAMPQGGTLLVETSSGNGSVTVIIRDTGSGISEEDQKKIFEPLFTTKVKGTGLGLAIVQRIIEAHRGQIALKSIPGQGAEFTLRLPL
ncbi:MAG: GHKL domain-containing protein, partial [Elusimicrobia bacterium]|nr:GHKL domain-containing protein [Elusimicrobiota bacterium]